MLVDKERELMSNLLFTVHQHGGDDATWKPPIVRSRYYGRHATPLRRYTRMSWLHNLWRRYFCFLQTARPLLCSVTWDQVLCSFLRLVNRRTHKKKCIRAGSDLWCLARITTGYKRVSSVWGKKKKLNYRKYFEVKWLREIYRSKRK